MHSTSTPPSAPGHLRNDDLGRKRCPRVDDAVEDSMFRIVWLGEGGKRREIGGLPMFGPGPVPIVAGRYVADRIWPQIQQDHPDLSGFALVDVETWEEVFRWPPPGFSPRST